MNILREPTGDLYRALLEYGRRSCDRFSLVERTERALDESAHRVLTDLASFCREERTVVEWPGTKLLDGSATLRFYELNATTSGILARATLGLYDWRQPARPEDLILWRPSGEPWLVSIAHERDAFLDLSSAEREALVQSLALELDA